MYPRRWIFVGGAFLDHWCEEYLGNDGAELAQTS